MNLDYRMPSYRVFHAAAAAALALSLVSCGDKPPAETPKFEAAPEVVARQAQQAVAEMPKADAPAAPVDAKAAADKALAARVKAAIVSKPNLKFMAMDTKSSDGAVTLYGTADTEEQRQQAAKAAAEVPGVKSVKNELRIVRGS